MFLRSLPQAECLSRYRATVSEEKPAQESFLCRLFVRVSRAGFRGLGHLALLNAAFVPEPAALMHHLLVFQLFADFFFYKASAFFNGTHDQSPLD